MDQGLKERLIGAAVLVALGVWLIPWLLDGASDPVEARKPPLELPVPDAADAADAELKTEVIDLASPRPPTSAGASSVDARGVDVDAAAAGRGGGAKAATPAASSAAASPVGVDADAAELEAAKLDAAKAETAKATPDRAGATADGSRTGDARADTTKAVKTVKAEPAKAETAKAETAKAETAKAETAKAASTKAAPPKASSAGIVAPAAKGDWAIQLGSFGDKENAERLASRVAAFGVKPHITTYRADGRLMYRVRLGPYETRAKAEAAASGLGAHGFVAQVVTAS
jgi:cell division septation protein DedD